jgi:hypothetical protein
MTTDYTNETEWQFMIRSAHYVTASRRMTPEESFASYYEILHGAFTYLLTSAQSGVYFNTMYEQAVSFYEFIHEFSVRLRTVEADRCNTLSTMRTQLMERYTVI